jgi:hypothetical protein
LHFYGQVSCCSQRSCTLPMCFYGQVSCCSQRSYTFPMCFLWANLMFPSKILHVPNVFIWASHLKVAIYTLNIVIFESGILGSLIPRCYWLSKSVILSRFQAKCSSMKCPILVHNSLIIPPKNDEPSEVEFLVL